MKKHLIAAGVVAAFAAPAMAQNVSVYGVLDTGIQAYDSGAASNSNVTRTVDGALATSRLGFKGTEDLGGGLKASFKLEARLNPAAGTNNSTNFFNRGANVTLSGGFGAITLGMNDTTGTQDIDSSVSQAGNLGLRPSFQATVTGNGELGSDVASVIRYATPTFNGFSAEFGYTANANDSVTDAGTSITDLTVKYTNGPMAVYLGSSKQDNATAANKADFRTLGVSYNAGFASFGFTTSSADVRGGAANSAGRVKTSVASAKVPLSNGLAVHAVMANASESGVANAKGNGYTVALTKALSKRTTVYGGYTSSTSDSAAAFAMAGNTLTGATTDGTDQSAVTIGVSHSF
jgi:predicted porin